MHNKSTFWIPGFDHASIATQSLIEKKLEKERSVTRFDIGRENLLSLIEEWKEDQCSKMRHQLKILGAQLNWPFEYYTMDKHQEKAVQKAFIDLFDEGLIYRDEKLINWSCALQSTVSDIEINYLEIDGPTKVKVPGYDDEIVFGLMTKFVYKVNGILKTQF